MKLGGSLLTDKSTYRTPRPDAIRRLAEELRTTREPLVVVHGAGSFGHVLAKRHGLAEGKGTPGSAARVHADVRDLQGLVVAALHDAGSPALALSTADLWPSVAVRTAQALASGFVPVLPGDVVLEGDAWRIVSGDVLMVELARALRPRRAVFATDVDGIFDQWPGGRLVERIGAGDEPFAGAGRGAGAGAGADVTGGMRGKLERAREVARHAPVLIVNGNVPGRLADAVAGRDVVGTWVTG